jgi:hypothetical protein
MAGRAIPEWLRRNPLALRISFGRRTVVGQLGVAVRQVVIRQITVDEAGRLLVVPDLSPQEDFAFIYRAAMEVSWNPSARALLSPELRPGGWTYADWFRQIVRAAADEYRTKLVIDGRTSWSVAEEVRRQIESGLERS